MDKKLQEEIKQAWMLWGKEKPWYCPECKCLMNPDFFKECSGGYHPYKGVAPNTPYHDTIVAERSLTFEEFCQAYVEIDKL
jgi:hypothetical protein